MKKPKSNQPQQQYMQNPYMSPNYPYYMPQPQQPSQAASRFKGKAKEVRPYLFWRQWCPARPKSTAH